MRGTQDEKQVQTRMKYHVQRSTLIEKDINSVRPLIEDFNRWNSWSPWTIAEPDCPLEITGTPGEAGHSMRWDGQIIGSGINTLIRNDEKRLEYDLQFLAPFKSKAKTGFTLDETGDGTHVTWTMDGSMPFFLFFMINMMKGWIAMDYDRGLRMLKAVAEKGGVNARTTNKGLVDITGLSYVGLKRTVSIEEIGDVMKKDFEAIVEEVVHKRGKAARHWLTLYPKMDMKNLQLTYIAAISDEELGDESLGPEYVSGTIQNGRALEISHEGAYEFLGNGWSMGMMYLRAKKMKQKDIPFEQYWNSPMEVEPDELKTSIYFPLK